MSARSQKSSYGLITLTALVIANMIGAGVFTTSGFALADLHSPSRVVLAWWVAGGIALCGALAYGALAEVLQESGGEYLYLSQLVHPAMGFIAGWVSLLAGFTGAIALAALTLEAYLYPMHGWLAVAAIALCAILHGIHKAPGAWMQNAMVTIKLLLLFYIVLTASSFTGTEPATTAAPPAFSASTFAESLMWISLSYAGFNAAIYVTGEARSGRSVRLALWLGTAITMLLYVGLNHVFVHAAPYSALAGQERVAAIAIEALEQPLTLRLFQIVVPLALFTSVSAMMLAGPRVYAQMAKDGRLPKWLRFESGATVPRKAICFQAVLALSFIYLASIRDLLTYLGFTLSLTSAAAVGTLFLIHRRGLAKIKPIPRIAAAIYVVMTLGTASIGAWLNPWQGVAGLLTLATGYLGFKISESA